MTSSTTSGNALEVLQKIWQPQYEMGTDGNLYLMGGPEIVYNIPPDGKLGVFYDTNNTLSETLHKPLPPIWSTKCSSSIAPTR